jgi:hypothetical protein
VPKRWARLAAAPPGLGSSSFLQEALAGLFESALKGLRMEVLAPVDQAKQRFELVQEPLAILGNGSIGRLGEKAHLANQMRQAKLYRHRRLVHVGAIGRKVIVPRHRGAGVAQEVFQDLAASGGGDVKQGKGGRAQHPGP